MFEKARYYYEFYEDKTQEEYENIGEEWIAKGMLEDEAKVSYYPTELNGLIEGMSDYIKNTLAEK